MGVVRASTSDMAPALAEDYFALFGLPPVFEVDRESLSQRYRDLQRATHPDRFANASDQERLLSVQNAALVNQAFQTLKNPLSRARYLLELRGYALDDTDNRMDTGFLMEQMALREALAEVRGADDPFDALNRLRDDIESRERDLVAELAGLLAQDGEDAARTAQNEVRKMQFMRRLLEEVAEIEEDLVHAF